MSLDRIRERVKGGMHPREVLIEEYAEEWRTDPNNAQRRLERWRGTATGDAILEGARRAGLLGGVGE